MSSLLAAAAVLAAQASTTGGAATPTDVPELHTGSISYLDLEAGVGYSTNPVQSITSSTGRAYGRISLHGVHSRVSERTTTTFSAFAQDTTYTGRYGSLQSFSVNAHHDAAVNEKLRLFADASASYDEGGRLDSRIFVLPDVPPLPGAVDIPPPLLPPGSDFLSVTGRSYRVAGDFGGSLSLSPHDNLSFSSGISHVVFRGGGQDTSYTTIPASIGYNRQLNARASVGAQVQFQDTNYSGPGHSQEITPQATGSLLLSERVSLSGALGVSFARFDDGLTVRHSTGLSAQAALCGRGETDRYCARASVDQQAATTAGPAKTISVGVDYSRQLAPDSSIALSLDASHYSSPISILSGRIFSSSTYYRASVDYSRRLNGHLFGGVNLAARKLSQSGPDPKTDFDASLFIRYRFGDLHE
jgi:hypothetical protein